MVIYDMIIADLGSIVTGKTPSTKNDEYWNGNVPFVTPGDIQVVKHILSTSRCVTEEGMQAVEGAILPAGAICVSCIGNIGYVGKTVKQCISNQQINSIIVSEEHNPDYVFYLMKSLWPFFKNYEGQSTTVSILNKGQFSKIEIIERTKEEEDKIADILNSIDAKIELNNRINDNLTEQARTLYKCIISNSSEDALLSAYVSIKHGFAFKGDFITFENNNVVLVTPGNFKIGGGFQENKCKYFSAEYPEDYVLHANDLIVTMTDLSKEADTLGYGALVPDNPERVYLHNQRIGLVQFLTDKLSKDYVYWFLRSYDYHRRIVGSASGSTVKHTSPGRILEQRIPVPKDEDKSKIAHLKEIDDAIASNDLENARLSSIRDTLLPRLMSGELYPPEIGNIV